MMPYLKSVKKKEKSEMKTVKRLLVPVLVLAAILSAFASGASADGTDTVFFNVWVNNTTTEYKPFPVRGELSVGRNDVTVNDGCLRFEAENAGYYAIDVDSSETDRYICFDISETDGENKEKRSVFSTNGPSTWIDTIEGADGYTGTVFYIDKPGTYYSRLYTEHYVDGEFVNGEKFACSADIRFLGDLVSVDFGKDPLCLGPDVEIIWDGDAVIFACDLTFSAGSAYRCETIGRPDKLEAGKRTILFNISNGPDVNVNVNFITLAQKTGKIVLPAGYTPTVKYSFPNNILDSYKTAFSHPEYVELHFKDGTVKKVDLPSKDFWLECNGGFTLGEETHFVETKFSLINEKDWVFRVYIDGLLYEEMPAKITFSFLSDLSVYFSGIGQLLSSLSYTGNINGTLDNIIAVPALAGRLTKRFFIDYLFFVLGKSFSLI